MKKLVALIIAVCLASGIQTINGQEIKEPVKIYNPEANAREDINMAIAQAKAENKHVFIQVGGNWCGWCKLFHAYIDEDPEIKKLLEEKYVFTLLNWSPENYNTELMKEYRNPARLGFPVFLILDGNGTLIHTQDSGLLEEGKGYNKVKVMTFLKKWTFEALDPKNIK
ncbi:MAG: thioredoxin family protein [Bacteroidota bacterium]